MKQLCASMVTSLLDEVPGGKLSYLGHRLDFISLIVK